MREIRTLLGWAAALLLAILFMLLAIVILGPLQWIDDRRRKKTEQEYFERLGISYEKVINDRERYAKCSQDSFGC